MIHRQDLRHGNRLFHHLSGSDLSEKNVGILHGLGRHNANFESMKQLEALKAQEIAAELLGPTYRLNPLPENGGTIYFHASDPADESFEAVLKLEKTP